MIRPEKNLIPVEDARSIIQASIQFLPSEVIALGHSKKRILAEALVARADRPAFSSSGMDGFLVCPLNDLRKNHSYEILGVLKAGDPLPESLDPGCYKVMTGAALPSDCGIIPVEWTEVDGSQVRFEKISEEGQFVRPAGQDFRKGDQILEKGTLLNSFSQALLASQGILEMPVHRQARVAILTTGDELVAIDQEPKPGQLRNSNALAIELLCEDQGIKDIHQVHVTDDLVQTKEALIHLAETSDLVFTSGGVSMGDYDFVGQAVEEAGSTILFWKVLQRPGKPIAFSLLNGTPILHLPGNPISTMVCFLQYGRFALARLMGRDFTPLLSRAIVEEDLVLNRDLHQFVRGIVNNGSVKSTGNQASNLISSLAKANCLIHLPPGEGIVKAGAEVKIEVLDYL